MSSSTSSPPPTNFTDEQVTQFMAFTGSSDPSRASSYLEMSGGDIETATSLYFEHHSGAASSSAGGGSQNRGSSAAAIGGSGINDDSGMMGEGDEVRAPDPTRRTRLMDFEGPSGGGMGPFIGNSMPNMNGMLHGGITEEMIRSIRAADLRNSGMGGGHMGEGHMGNPFGVGEEIPSSRFRDAINNAAAADMDNEREGNAGNDDDDDLDVDDEVEDVDMEPPRPSARARRLGDMFAAPTHLIYNQGGFQGARNMAKDSKRWLLVNLQSDADFACHALNRDVWRNDLVENLVREGFIFWQSSDNESEGQTYAQRYNVLFYPHIAIIDPRTGRQMWKKEGWTAENPLTATEFAERAADFCSHHSFDKGPTAPRGAASGIGNVRTASNGSSSAAAATAPEMSEDQQLAAAIAASMNPSSEQMNESDSDSDESVVIVDEMKIEDEDKPPTFEEEIVSLEVGEEPSGTDGVARIMIRMPDGKRLIRKFLLIDRVKKVYAFIAQCNDDAKGGKAFECKFGFPPKDLRTSVDNTVESTGLAGDTITVRWK